MPIAFEHVLPERFDFVDVAAFAIHRDTCQQETFCERTFKTYRLFERALQFLGFIFAQPERAGQLDTQVQLRS